MWSPSIVFKKPLPWVSFALLSIILYLTSDAKSNHVQAVTTAIGGSFGIVTGFDFLWSLYVKSRATSKERLRTNILDIQRNRWIERVLKPSLGDSLIKVDFKPDKVLADNITEYFDNFNADRRMNSTNEPTITDAYNAASWQLVILGKAGSGKTIALLKLFEELQAEAYNQSTGVIPVVLRLSSWASWYESQQATSSERRKGFDDWLFQELSDVCKNTESAKKTLKDLIKARSFEVLLDGYDEVPSVYRKYLSEDIQNYFFSQGERSIPNNRRTRARFVITSRGEEFREEATLTSMIGSTLELSSIKDSDIRNYLNDRKNNLLLNLCNRKEYEFFANALRLPFLLNAVAESYISMKDINELEDGLREGFDTVGDEGVMQKVPVFILEKYINQQLNRVSEGALITDILDFDSDTTQKYLSFIAARIPSRASDNPHEGQVILVDYLQPSWLCDVDKGSKKHNHTKWELFYMLASRMLGSMAIAASIGFLLASPLDYFWPGILTGFTIGMFEQKLQMQKDLISPHRFSSIAYYLCLLYLSCSIVLSVLWGAWLPSPPGDQIHIFSIPISLTGLTLAWFIALPIVTIYTIRNIHLGIDTYDRLEDISPVERINKFTSSQISTFFKYAFLGGLGTGSLFAVFALFLSMRNTGTSSVWMREHDFQYGLLITSLAYGFLLGFFFGGLITGVFGLLEIKLEIQDNKPIRTSQGIRQSIRNAILVFVRLSLAIGSVSSYVLWQFYHDYDVVSRGFRTGFAIGALGGLWYGGLDVIHHMVLRFTLYASGRAPWRISHFLEYCSQLNLMRETGTSYVFSHVYLQLFYSFKSKEYKKLIRPRNHIVLAAIAIVFGFMLWISIGFPLLKERLYTFNFEFNYRVSGTTKQMIDGAPFPVKRGSTVKIESRGSIFTGHFLGYITSEGTNIGILGLPIGQKYNIDMALPNNALLCKLSSEPTWRKCAERSDPSFFPWSTRLMSFKATSDGVLMFGINEIEHQKRQGAYYVHAKIIK